MLKTRKHSLIILFMIGFVLVLIFDVGASPEQANAFYESSFFPNTDDYLLPEVKLFVEMVESLFDLISNSVSK